MTRYTDSREYQEAIEMQRETDQRIARRAIVLEGAFCFVVGIIVFLVVRG